MVLRLLLLLAAMATATASAQTLETRAALEQIQAHRRVASAYLQTGNADLALVEIDRLRGALSRGAAASTPTDAALSAAIEAARVRADESLRAAETGDLDRARSLLLSGGAGLDEWRRQAGIVLFSDCIAQVSAAYEALDVHRTTPSGLSDRGVRDGVARAASATAEALATCAARAPDDIRGNPEFARLIDGFLASLRLVPDALAKQDRDYLHRLLIEQRSFERLLSFRFG